MARKTSVKLQRNRRGKWHLQILRFASQTVGEASPPISIARPQERVRHHPPRDREILERTAPDAASPVKSSAPQTVSANQASTASRIGDTCWPLRRTYPTGPMAAVESIRFGDLRKAGLTQECPGGRCRMAGEPFALRSNHRLSKPCTSRCAALSTPRGDAGQTPLLLVVDILLIGLAKPVGEHLPILGRRFAELRLASGTPPLPVWLGTQTRNARPALLREARLCRDATASHVDRFASRSNAVPQVNPRDSAQPTHQRVMLSVRDTSRFP